ncbi:restriction endonuclease subunit S [Turicibacter sanguinis]|uniref:restriction endonuclease subunit S n=1 Tax=Turicibacter sanguinis TaxID=154288 RepID=UPI00104A77A6|nr:restriction endonuclease subunit S [Turicibacter sanguinis]QJS19226.1 hypothetical protein HLK68_08120 [Turicibacter sanguinis]
MSKEKQDLWQEYNFFDVIEVLDFRGRTPKKLNLDWGGDIPALSANNVKMGKIDYSLTTNFGSEELYSKWMTKGDLEIGDLVLTTEAPAGNVVVINDNKKYILSQRVIGLKPDKRVIDSNYLMYFFMSNYFKNYLQGYGTGTTVTGISQKNLEFLKIIAPPLEEQQKIAEILSSVDAAIEKTEQVIAKTEEVKKGLMQQILTKGIGHTEFKQTEIGEIPVGWNVINLEEICSLITYGFTNPMPTTDEGPYMITAKDIRDGDIQYKTARKTSMECYSNDLTDKSRPSIGDILITKDGTLGRLAIVKQEDICINQSVARIVLKDINLVKYIYYLLDSPQVQTRILAESGGSTIKHIYITKLAKTLIPISTDVEEIKNITNILDSYDYKISSEKRKCNYLINIKKGLMQQLLTGQVRVKID